MAGYGVTVKLFATKLETELHTLQRSYEGGRLCEDSVNIFRS